MNSSVDGAIRPRCNFLELKKLSLKLFRLEFRSLGGGYLGVHDLLGLHLNPVIVSQEVIVELRVFIIN